MRSTADAAPPQTASTPPAVPETAKVREAAGFALVITVIVAIIGVQVVALRRELDAVQTTRSASVVTAAALTPKAHAPDFEVEKPKKSLKLGARVLEFIGREFPAPIVTGAAGITDLISLA